MGTRTLEELWDEVQTLVKQLARIKQKSKQERLDFDAKSELKKQIWKLQKEIEELEDAEDAKGGRRLTQVAQGLQQAQGLQPLSLMFDSHMEGAARLHGSSAGEFCRQHFTLVILLVALILFKLKLGKH